MAGAMGYLSMCECFSKSDAFQLSDALSSETVKRPESCWINIFPEALRSAPKLDLAESLVKHKTLLFL